MTDIMECYAICVDGPLAGEDFACPPQTVQLLYFGHHYRFIGYVNGVAQYGYVTHR